MSVFKIWKGKRITARDKNWSKGTWYVWRRIKGVKKPIHQSIPLAQTKEEAELAERELIRQAFNKTYGVKSRETVADFVERVYRNFVRQHNVNQSVKDLYIRLLNDNMGNRAIADITPQDCRNIQSVFKKKYSASTVNQLMSTASKIFTLAGQERIIDTNPMQFVSRLKEPPPRDRLLSKEEWERLWKAIEPDSLMRRLLALATNVPLRRGQLLAISPDAIDWQNGLLSIIPSKGRGGRIIPLNNTAMDTLRELDSDGQLPFPLKETGIRKRWVKAMNRAKIKGFRFHDLRHCTATELMRNGVPIETIRKLYGHSDLKITRIYVNPEMADMAAAMNTLDVQESEVLQ